MGTALARALARRRLTASADSTSMPPKRSKLRRARRREAESIASNRGDVVASSRSRSSRPIRSSRWSRAQAGCSARRRASRSALALAIPIGWRAGSARRASAALPCSKYRYPAPARRSNAAKASAWLRAIRLLPREAAGVLDAALCPKRFFLGAAGNGGRAKLAINLILGLNRAAIAEGARIRRAPGSRAASHFLEVAKGSAAYSQVMDVKGAFWAERPLRAADESSRSEPQGFQADAGDGATGRRRIAVRIAICGAHERLRRARRSRDGQRDHRQRDSAAEPRRV